MNAKEKLMEYAAKNNDRTVYTDEQYLGQMFTEGIRLDYRTTARIHRSGKEITIVETTTTETLEGKERTDKVVLEVSL